MSAHDESATAQGVNDATAHVSTRARALLDRDDEGAPNPPPDPFIADLVEEFLEGRRADAARMPALLAARDLTALERIGHNMRGCGTSFGFPRITAMGAALEVAAHEGDLAIATEVADRLARFLTRL